MLSSTTYAYYDTIPDEDTTLFPSSSDAGGENHRSNSRSRMTTLGAAVLVVIGRLLCRKIPFGFGC